MRDTVVEHAELVGVAVVGNAEEAAVVEQAEPDEHELELAGAAVAVAA